MKAYSIWLVLLLPIVVIGVQYDCILEEIPGFERGQPDAKIEIQIIYDPLCPDSRDFDVKTWRKVEKLILNDKELKERVKFRYLVLPLPYHLYSNKPVQAILHTSEQSH